MTSPIVTGEDILINEDNGYTITSVECPHCRRGFAVEEDYLRKVDRIVHCPICCQIVKIMEVSNAEKIKERKVVLGENVYRIDGNRTYLTCITDTGERFSIGFNQLFELFDNYKIILEKHGEHFRTIGFEQHSQDV